ncbi:MULTISPECIES: hypothetical protein [unclassified Stenotrophomonas]|uniref:hypothetical protein n=1 Tax=unclassified Stenotrophomonas TaxID=196198 RepID=UPI002447F2DD|nr:MULTISPECIES: hypothetical protein [unclassified Stenotrophomonas]MDH0273188.1 hypothetical protein [Stenotrophomonas sp. GD04089]MDH1910703.1 hypothetical protein [Stenotrophomonas sp. GD03794]
MSRAPVVYRTMRCSIPEGSEVVLHVPEHIGVESLDMAAECIALQMRIFKRHAEMAQPATTQEPEAHG